MHRGLPPTLQLPADMPPAVHWRAIRALFALAGSGPAGAFAAAALTALPCAVVERWFWLPAPVNVPMHLLAAGFVMALATTVRPGLGPALGLGAFLGEVLGLLLPGVAPAVPGSDPTAAALRLAIVVGLAGTLAGTALNLAFARLRPALDRRFAVGFPFAALGAFVGGLAALVLLPRGLPPLHAYFTVALALGLGLIAIGVPLNVVWLYAHGFELLHARPWRALVATFATIGALLAGLYFDVAGLGLGAYLLLIASALLFAGVRIPLRISAPLTSATYFAVVSIVVARDAHRDVLTDARSVVTLQIGLIFAIACVFMHSASYTARLLFEQRLHRYARQLEVAEADHRRVSASAVREGLSQSLAGVRFALSALHSVGLPPSARRSLDDTLELLRAAERDAELAHRELGPVGLEEHGIETVLHSYLNKVAQDGTLEFELVASGPLDALPVATRRLAFRIVVELVAEGARAGASRRLLVALEATPVELFMTVRDAGAATLPGPAALAPDSGSRLALLRERVVLEGGDLHLRAANDDDATEIRVTLPLRRA